MRSRMRQAWHVACGLEPDRPARQLREPPREWTRPMAVRPHARNLVVSGAIAAIVALTACGAAAAPGGGHAGPPSSKPAKVSLTLKVISPGQPTKHWTLRCDPPGGSAPDPAAVCRVLLHAKQPFTIPVKHVMCPMIMVSGRSVAVSGTWFGKRVKRTLLDGGCDLTIYRNILQTLR